MKYSLYQGWIFFMPAHMHGFMYSIVRYNKFTGEFSKLDSKHMKFGSLQSKSMVQVFNSIYLFDDLTPRIRKLSNLGKVSSKV